MARRRRNEWDEQQDFEDLQEFMDRLEQSAGQQIQWDDLRSQSQTPNVYVQGIGEDNILTQRERFQVQYLNARHPNFDPENPSLVIDHWAVLERYYDFVNNEWPTQEPVERVSPRYTPRRSAPEFEGGGFGFRRSSDGELRPSTFGSLLRMENVQHVGQVAQMPTNVVVESVKQQMVTGNHYPGQYGRPVGNQTGDFGGVGQMTYTTSKESVDSYFNLSDQAFGTFTAPHAQMPPVLVEHGVKAGVDIVQNLAATDFISTNPDDQVASIRSLSRSAIKEAVAHAESFLQSVKTAPDQMPSLRQKYETVLYDAVNTAIKSIEDVVKSPTAPDRLQTSGYQIGNTAAVEHLRRIDPTFAERTAGMPPEEVLAKGAGQRYYSASQGAIFEFGGRGGGQSPPGDFTGFDGPDPRGTGRTGGMFGGRGKSIYGSAGPAGSLFYGMYMARRTWQMTVDPLLQQAQDYTDIQQQRAMVAGMGQEGGSGVDPSYRARSTSDLIKAQAAYDLVGGFDRLTQDVSPAGQRMRATGQLASGAIMGGVVAQWGLGMAGEGFAKAGLSAVEAAKAAGGVSRAGGVIAGIGGALQGVAPALGMAGLVVGGGLLAGQGLMELYNATNNPEVPLSWGELVSPRFGQLRSDYEEEARQWYEDNGLNVNQGRLAPIGEVTGFERMSQATIQSQRDVFGGTPTGFERMTTTRERMSTTQIRAYLEATGIDKTLSPNQLMEYGLGEQYERQKAYQSVEEKLIDTYGGEAGDYGGLFAVTEQQFGIGRASDAEFLGGLYAKGTEFGDSEWVGKVSALGGALGYKTGSQEMQNYIQQYEEMTAGEFREQMATDQRRAAAGQSLSQYFEKADYGAWLQARTGIVTSPGLSQMSRIMAPLAGTMGDQQLMDRAASIYERFNNFGLPTAQTGLLTQAFGNFVSGGMPSWSAEQGIVGMVEAGTAPGVIAGISQMDPFAISMGAYQVDPNGAMGMPVQYDQFGVAMGKYSGLGTANWAAQQAGLPNLGQQLFGNQLGLQNLGEVGLNPNAYSIQTLMEAIQPYGFNDPEYAQAYIQGGMTGVQDLYQSNMAQLQSAQIGIGFQGIALKENAFWGAGRGGTWDNPAANSIWGLQDQLTNLQFRSQMEGFQFSREGLEANRAFDLIQRSLQERQTTVSREYQDWGMDFGYETSLMSRERNRERMDFQDTMGSLQFGWSMEDINDAISRSSGQQRKQLVTQRERMSTSQNLQTGENERQREYQEELWAREDERFDAQVENINKLRELEDERTEETIKHTDSLYKLQKDHLEYQEETAKKAQRLQLRLQEEQRKLTMQQMELQKQSLGIQAAMLKEGEKLKDVQKGNQDLIDKQQGSFNQLKVKADQAGLGIQGLVRDIGKLQQAANSFSLPSWVIYGFFGP